MSFQIKDLPYSQFEQLGMSRKDVITMPAHELANLLEGRRTGLISLRIHLKEGMKPIEAQAKLSLTRNPDNTLSLGVHPILARPVNNIEANEEQWNKLLKGEAIVKNSKALNGSIEPHIHQLDKETNEILSARLSAIQIPNAIKDTVLSVDQKEQLKKGLPVEIVNKSTKDINIVQIDLNEPKGYKITDANQFRQKPEVTMVKLEEPTLAVSSEKIKGVKR
ncbi:DUF4099 domain-containing protein [Adhaeribacter radiodurans]|uniref:DUF4099 domain-containing protein n=1 Tax=Adhaeribacter radiodurans TaxID=2745197 RepID=A0A7L7L184_9BACT|nr:DUF4099 domain-containing protein [Adhaeribacter radiodurans]QMU26556.1 DUF4099 domain-containing protein [Adhaeribacter radiodurans]